MYLRIYLIMLVYICENEIKNEMEKCILNFKEKIKIFRTNFIDIDIISNLLVHCYGKYISLMNLSRIILDNNHTIRISLFDKNIKNIVKKSILLSKLNLNPVDCNDDIIIYFPPLNEEKRKDIVKKLKCELEKIKISIRNVRKIFNIENKCLLKKKLINKDVEKKNYKNIQDITDFYIKKADLTFISKKKQILVS